MVKLVYSTAERNGSALQGLIPLVPDHFYFFLNMKKLLLRKKDSKVGGVCGGLGDYFGIDETIFRVLFFVGIFTPLPSMFTYILLWIIIPKEKII